MYHQNLTDANAHTFKMNNFIEEKKFIYLVIYIINVLDKTKTQNSLNEKTKTKKIWISIVNVCDTC